VEVNQKQQPPSDDGHKRSKTAARQEKDAGELAPGITIVRDSTPRPLSLGPLLSALTNGQVPAQEQQREGTPLSDFPTSAPSAPPVPEELSNVGEDTIAETAASVDHANQALKEMVHLEPDTESLPTFRGISNRDIGTPLLVQVENGAKTAESIHRESQGAAIHSSPWLVIFAIYLATELLMVLIFAVLRGMGFGNTVLTNDFTLLGAPWLVLTYGLLGGCLSCIISLGHLRTTHPPVFIIITWFTRPYIGAALALFSYVFLTSGFFIFDRSGGKHDAFFLLIGALAGLCEGWIFQRRNNL
jgi:hypothetical protein